MTAGEGFETTTLWLWASHVFCPWLIWSENFRVYCSCRSSLCSKIRKIRKHLLPVHSQWTLYFLHFRTTAWAPALMHDHAYPAWNRIAPFPARLGNLWITWLHDTSTFVSRHIFQCYRIVIKARKTCDLFYSYSSSPFLVFRAFYLSTLNTKGNSHE